MFQKIEGGNDGMKGNIAAGLPEKILEYCQVGL
jgi:hypothetical protein